MFDVLILGAGAAGLTCARECAARGRRTLALDHAGVPGAKIRISGGGKCNFTNTGASARDYVCSNPHFVKSALSQYTPWDFVDFMQRHGLPVRDMGRGMLFSDKAKAVAEALYRDALAMGAEFALNIAIRSAKMENGVFRVDTDRGAFSGRSLVLAVGGPAWPQAGASSLGCTLAERFGLRCLETRPGLVPLVAGQDLAPLCRELTGVSLPVRIAPPHSAEGALLFTHHGVSGPAVLDASLAWREGRTLSIDLAPDVDVVEAMGKSPRMEVRNALAGLLPKRLAGWLCTRGGWEGPVAGLSRKQLTALEAALHSFEFTPRGTAGYSKAEVTLGGVDTDHFSSKTMEAKQIPGLYCVGELLDVTGRLGGYNLQWAWSSGYAAGRWA
ncbi:aminoacetone oxidase family FAD-binding enzyme [Oceanidesulfovibrio indonesiensis]|uniref:Aminoacetone oxidase family FAD-binding enzyme n=1 Tax=Oceanidesulfovibrio indonesiensis TaxID=54767 RepID=A0A7M3MCZ2_9BACT|nr:aminoacetone oxidase family FAD-binding enzyme [Oceanidesulfovibrio indonesiensis]TVM16388.1 aminoacetone oxidase family FAD-binding enzyme [Oceanidesulfovibrio indonesiensis]